MNDDNNQTTQIFSVAFHGRGGNIDPWGDFPLLQVTKTREKPEDPGTIVWSMVCIVGGRRLLTTEQANEALLELFYQQAVEVNAPIPTPPLLFGNVRIQNL